MCLSTAGLRNSESFSSVLNLGYLDPHSESTCGRVEVCPQDRQVHRRNLQGRTAKHAYKPDCNVKRNALRLIQLWVRGQKEPSRQVERFCNLGVSSGSVPVAVGGRGVGAP